MKALAPMPRDVVRHRRVVLSLIILAYPIGGDGLHNNEGNGTGSTLPAAMMTAAAGAGEVIPQQQGQSTQQ